MEQLIKKYWERTLNEEEKQRLQTWLSEAHPSFENKLREAFFADLEKHTSDTEIMEKKFSIVLNNIKAKISPINTVDKRPRVFSLKVWQYAAAIIIMVSAVLFLRFESGKEAALVYNKVIKNRNSDRNMAVVLADQSHVVLYPHSQISINSDFNKAERLIILQKGKALFKVAKNKQKRFMVNSGDYQTIALGTEFEIDIKDGIPRILLNEGKIVVKSVPNAPYAIPDYYLNPGESLLIDSKKHILTKGNTSSTSPVKIKDRNEDPDKIYDAQALSLPNNNTEIHFNKDSLNHVFRQLGRSHHIIIRYNKEDISNKLFTGKIRINDNIDPVLSIICESNDLQIIKKGTVYHVSKK